MSEAAQIVEKELKNVNFERPITSFISNVTADEVLKGRIKHFFQQLKYIYISLPLYKLLIIFI
jgi:hypothetical protein